MAKTATKRADHLSVAPERGPLLGSLLNERELSLREKKIQMANMATRRMAKPVVFR